MPKDLVRLPHLPPHGVGHPRTEVMRIHEVPSVFEQFTIQHVHMLSSKVIVRSYISIFLLKAKI